MPGKRAFLRALAGYLPAAVFTNEDIAEQYPKWSGESILEKIGIGKRHIAAAQEGVSDMAVKAALALFAENPDIKKEEIDFVILCTQSADFTIPTTACIVQHELKLKKEVGAFDYNLGCSGFVYGLGIAKGLVVSGQANGVLLITAEVYSKRIHPDDFKNRSLFGDAAVAVFVSDTPRASAGEILDFCYATDGEKYDKLIRFNSGNTISGKEERFPVKYAETSYGNEFLYMDGQAIFEFTLMNVPGLIDRTLAKNNLEKSQIDLFVLHQANKFMLEAIRKRAKIDDEKFYNSMKEVGNTVSSTIPLALIDAIKDQKIQAGNKVLLAGFGVGLPMAGCILSY